MGIRLVSLGEVKNFLEVADKVGFENKTGNFILDEAVTGGTSKAEAKVSNISTDYLELIPLSGSLQAAETITGGLSGATATTTYVTGRFDTLLANLVEGISAQIETFLNRKLKKESRTAYFPSGGKVFSLPAYPVDEAQTFTVTVWDAARTKDDDYFLDPDIGLIEFVYDTETPRPRKVKVVYTGGYEETEGVLGVPNDLKHACLLQASFEFRRRKDLGLASVSMPDGSVSVHQPADLLPKVQKILQSHRRAAL